MLNNKVSIKSTLLENGIQSYIETLTKITLEFKNSEIMVGYCQGEKNPADMMTKLFKDPCAIINSSFYRYGDENMGKASNLEVDTVAKVSKGVFEFIGILERFLNRVEEDRCFQCTDEECALIKLVQTRRQEKEMKEQDQEETEEIRKTHELTKTQKWVLGIKRKFQVSRSKLHLHDQVNTFGRGVQECGGKALFACSAV